MGRRPPDAPRAQRYPNFQFHEGKYANPFPHPGRHLDIEVHSFDNLTELLSRRIDYRTYIPDVQWELSQLTPEVRNMLASPFHMALRDAEWRDIVSECGGSVSHMTSKLSNKLVAHLKPSPRLEKFDRILLGELRKTSRNSTGRAFSQMGRFRLLPSSWNKSLVPMMKQRGARDTWQDPAWGRSGNRDAARSGNPDAASIGIRPLRFFGAPLGATSFSPGCESRDFSACRKRLDDDASQNDARSRRADRA
jgi:hypothetical protein